MTENGKKNGNNDKGVVNNEPLRSVHTSNLPQIFDQLGISLVVSTYQAGRVILVRNDGGKLNTHFRTFNKPMGIAFDQNRLTIDGIPEGMCLDPDDMPLTTDQRELPKPEDGDDDGIALCDIGAFELQVDDGDGGCSIIDTQVNTKSSLSNFFLTLIPALFGFAGLIIGRRKNI